MLLNTLNAQDHPPQRRHFPAPKVSIAVEKSWLKLSFVCNLAQFNVNSIFTSARLYEVSRFTVLIISDPLLCLTYSGQLHGA